VDTIFSYLVGGLPVDNNQMPSLVLAPSLCRLDVNEVAGRRDAHAATQGQHDVTRSRHGKSFVQHCLVKVIAKVDDGILELSAAACGERYKADETRGQKCPGVAEFSSFEQRRLFYPLACKSAP
jgi:hypothetical protein